MKRKLWLFAALILCAVILVAQAAPPAAPAPAPAAAKSLPGSEAAQTLSLITGVAISPLLGVSAVGAWQYFHATEAQRPKLPWFAQMWFWLPALVIVGLCLSKDVLGPAVPTILKKPIDVAETVENKISGLVAAGAFVPLVAHFFPVVAQQNAALANGHFAAIDAGLVMNLLLTPFAVVAFAMVWLVSHTVHVLILISPFATVDAGLKAFRAFLLSTVVITGKMAESHPYIAGGWALLIIVISYFLAGWSFRLMVFGSVFIWDYATFRRHRFTPEPGGNWMFAARAIDRMPVRTYGLLARNEQGQLVFRYRPWLMFTPREQILPEAGYAIGRGLFYPELVRVEGDDYQSVLILPPRYASHEEELTRLYQLAPVQDIGLLRGFKAIGRWFRGRWGETKSPSAA